MVVRNSPGGKKRLAVVAIDLFCGCGGLTWGLQKAGVHVRMGIDINENCRLTFKLNNRGTKFLTCDLRNVSPRQILKEIEIDPSDHLLVAACAPCQPFSAQNRFKEASSDRTVLIQVQRLIRALQPDFVMLENVPGVLSVPGYSAFRRVLWCLNRLKYKTSVEKIDVVFYGVPQSRKRVVLLASVHPGLDFPKPTHGIGGGLLPLRTVRDTILRFPPIEAGQAHPIVANHVAGRLSEKNLQRIRLTPPDGGTRRGWPKEMVLSCHRSHKGHTDVYGRLRWDAPAPTLTTKCTSLSNGRYGHPEQDRALSLREAAALQGFDDEFVFYGAYDHIRQQIGNAVPPILAQTFGRHIVEFASVCNGSRKRTAWRKLCDAQDDDNPLNEVLL